MSVVHMVYRWTGRRTWCVGRCEEPAPGDVPIRSHVPPGGGQRDDRTMVSMVYLVTEAPGCETVVAYLRPPYPVHLSLLLGSQRCVHEPLGLLTSSMEFMPSTPTGLSPGFHTVIKDSDQGP